MARKSNIFTRILQLVLDKASIDKTKRETQKGLRDATDPKAAAKNIGVLEKSFSRLKVGAVALATALFTGLAFALRKVTTESIASQKAMAQQQAVLKSTGMAAGRTAEQLNEQADALARVTSFEDDAITATQNLLLTFRNIKGDEFDAATVAVLDMATALTEDASTAAVRLGKALNDPISGLTALNKAGVQFSKDQKDVIKNLVETGRTAEAQRLILKELEVQFGGSAAAARNTLGGALAGLKNAWNDLFEVSAQSSAGIITAINGIAAALPKLRDFFDTVFGAISVGIVNAQVEFARFELIAARVLQFSPLGVVMDMFAKGNQTAIGVEEATARLEQAIKSRDEFVAKLDALRQSPDALPALIDDVAEAAAGVGEAFDKAGAEMDRVLSERIGLLVEARDLGIATAEDEQQLVSLYGAIVRTLQAGNLELEERVRLSKLAASVAESFIGKREAEGPKAGETVGRFPLPDRGGGGLIAAPGAPILAPDIADLKTPAKETENAWVDALKTVGEEAEITSGLLQAAFDSRGFLAGLAQVASAKVKENIARSIETLAGGLAASVFGDPTKLPIAAKASAGFLAAAAAWGAIGGLAGGGGGGGGAGAAQSARTPAGRGADTVQRQQTITFIVNVDGIDPKNGVHQQKVGDTVGNIIQRVGNRITGGGLGGATR